jgi:glycolate oxidase FAD binding subunit
VAAVDNLMPPELAGACAEVRLAEPSDAVAGQPARFVAAPGSTREAAELLRAAAGLKLSVLARGSGTRIAWAPRPRACDLIIETRRLDQVVEHAAGDLVVTVQPGVRLDDLQGKLASEGQRLALDPPGGGTIGGILASGTAGPLQFRFGAPRDLLIGITVVLADGTIAKAGGKVVKNVAGYDLGKLFAGSYGTLGLIAQATFRLHPAPDASATIALETPDPAAAEKAAHLIAGSPLAPSAVELDWPSSPAPITVSALIEGDETSVAERSERLVKLLQREAAEIAAGPFALARPRLGGPAPTHLRVAFWQGQLAAVLTIIRTAATEQGLDPAVSGSAAGVLDVSLEQTWSPEPVVAFVSAVRAALGRLSDAVAGMPPAVASAVVVDAAPAVRDAVDMWGPVPSLGLMRAIKDQFDPEHRMAPGRFAGGT